MEAAKKGYHFVLVHGACHGAWCWYKLKPLLEASGHRVTSVDMAASGTNPKSIKEVKSISDYSEPLIEVMSTLSADEKVILVGHSLGGLNLALVMETFPDKVLVGVFLTAFLPDCVNKPSHVLEKFMTNIPMEAWMDTKFEPCGTSEKPSSSMLFSLDFLKHKLYQLCSVEDFTLATTLVRTSSMFIEDLANLPNFSSEGYGSVKRAYVVCEDDLAIPAEYQRWMIKNAQVKHVKEIEGTDHMAMLCKPRKLCDCLLEIANELG